LLRLFPQDSSTYPWDKKQKQDILYKKKGEGGNENNM